MDQPSITNTSSSLMAIIEIGSSLYKIIETLWNLIKSIFQQLIPLFNLLVM